MFNVQLFRGNKKDTTGTDERRGKKRLRRAAIVAAVASIAFTATATPAHAINLPNPFDCAWNSTFGAGDYFWFKVPSYSTGTVANLCYVNGGVMALDLSGVAGLHSGNNEGLYTADGRGFVHFNKWEDNWDYIGHVRSLGIY